MKDGVVVTAGQLRWDDLEAVEEMAGRWDTVLCADCLFFDAGRESLGKDFIMGFFCQK